MQRNRGAVSVIIIGDDHGAIARAYAKIHHIVAQRRRQHYARNVVSGKGQRAFNRTGCGDDLPCPYPPQPVFWPPVARSVISDAFFGQNIAMVIHPGSSCTNVQLYVIHCLQRRNSCINPIACGRAVDDIAVDHCAATPMGGLLHHHHPRAGSGRHQRRLQSGNAAAYHQNIAKRIDLFIAVGVAQRGGRPQTRRFADDRFKHVFPRRARVNEGFIVESGGQKPRQKGVHHPDIIGQRWPVVLAARLQTVEQFGCGGALVRFGPVAGAKVDQGVRLFDTGGNNAARTVVFETAPDQHLIIGQQRRGQGIARKAAQRGAVKGEFLGRAAVNQPPA